MSVARISSIVLEEYQRLVDSVLSAAYSSGLSDSVPYVPVEVRASSHFKGVGKKEIDPIDSTILVTVCLSAPPAYLPKGQVVLDMDRSSPSYRTFMVSRADPPDPPRWAPMLTTGSVFNPEMFLAAASTGTPGVADVNFTSASNTVQVVQKTANTGGLQFDLKALSDVQATNVQGSGNRILTLTINGTAKDVLESLTQITVDPSAHSFTYRNEGGTNVTVGAALFLSSVANNSLTVAADGGLFFQAQALIDDNQLLTGDTTGSVGLTLTPTTVPDPNNANATQTNYAFKAEVKLTATANVPSGRANLLKRAATNDVYVDPTDVTTALGLTFNVNKPAKTLELKDATGTLLAQLALTEVTNISGTKKRAWIDIT